MSDSMAEALTLDLLEWVSKGERTYEEDGRLAHLMPQTSDLGECE